MSIQREMVTCKQPQGGGEGASNSDVQGELGGIRRGTWALTLGQGSSKEEKGRQALQTKGTCPRRCQKSHYSGEWQEGRCGCHRREVQGVGNDQPTGTKTTPNVTTIILLTVLRAHPGKAGHPLCCRLCSFTCLQSRRD